MIVEIINFFIKIFVKIDCVGYVGGFDEVV